MSKKETNLSIFSEQELEALSKELNAALDLGEVSNVMSTAMYYNSLDGVAVDSRSLETLGNLKNDIQQAKAEVQSLMGHLSTFSARYEEKTESIDNRNRRIKGPRGYIKNVEERDKDVHRKQKAYSRAKREHGRFSFLRDVDPFEAIKARLTGDDSKKALEKYTSGRQKVKEAKRNLKQAKKDKNIAIETLADARKELQNAIAKRDIIESKVKATKEKIDQLKERALSNQKALSANSASLKAQYAIINRYMAIKHLKESKEFPTILATLRSQGKDELADGLESFPTSVPKDQFVISLEHPLTIDTLIANSPNYHSVSEKLTNEISNLTTLNTQTNQKNNELEGQNNKLRNDIQRANQDLTAAKEKLEAYKVKDGETYSSVTAEYNQKDEALQNLKKDGKKSGDPEYDKLAEEVTALSQKAEYLKYSERIQALEKEMTELTDSGDFSNDPEKLKTHLQKQQALKALKSTRNSLPYVKEMQRLGQSIETIQQTINNKQQQIDDNNLAIQENKTLIKNNEDRIANLNKKLDTVQSLSQFGNKFKALTEQLEAAKQNNTLALTNPRLTLNSLLEKINSALDRVTLRGIDAASRRPFTYNRAHHQHRNVTNPAERGDGDSQYDIILDESNPYEFDDEELDR